MSSCIIQIDGSKIPLKTNPILSWIKSRSWIKAFRILENTCLLWIENKPEHAEIPFEGMTIISTLEGNPVSELNPISLPLLPHWISESEKKAKDLGSLRNSITNGAGDLAGYVGEYLVAETLGHPIVSNDSFDFDIQTPLYDIDVKTKRCNSEIKPEYACSVTKKGSFQLCDIYVFCRINFAQNKGWILGYEFKDTFFHKATYGENNAPEKIEGVENNGFNYRADCYNVLIKDLTPFKCAQYNGITYLAF